MKDLKEKTLRGGLIKALAQAATFILRLGSIAILARMLDPTDFGLVGMVTAITGVLSIMKDAGLSAATVQRATISNQQLSTLFWLNVLVGVVLTVISLLLAPIVVRFYHEPRLFWVTIWLAPSFLFGSLGVQHAAILARQMRFSICAVIDVVALVVSSAVGVAMALSGHGYWALVGMSLALPAAASIGAWLACRWVPGPPHKDAEIHSMVRLGGALTFNSLIIYVAYNIDKVLLGRYWGAGAIGNYWRAYQLVNIPTENLNAAVGSVALSALSRLQDDAERRKSYFLKGYALLVALTIPATIACAVFAVEVVAVVLGAKWAATARIVQLLSPTILVFALINPTFWLVFSAGLMGRSVRMALVIAPLVITAYFIGLPYGPSGVALAFSIAMTIWLAPHIIWCLRGTEIKPMDIIRAAGRPLISGMVSALVCLAFELFLAPLFSMWMRLSLGLCILGVTYVGVLLYAMGQKEFYFDLCKSLLGRSGVAAAQ